MSAQTPFHFDSSLIGPRVYIKPGYRTFRQQLESTQQDRASVQAQTQRVQAVQAQAQPKAMLVEVPPRNVQAPINLAAAPMQQQPPQKCVYIVRRVAGSQNGGATISTVPPSPHHSDAGYEMGNPSMGSHPGHHHQYAHPHHSDPYSPGPLTPMSPPSGAPPSDADHSHWRGSEGTPMHGEPMHHVVMQPMPHADSAPVHSYAACQEPAPAREALAMASAPMPAAAPEGGAGMLSGGHKFKESTDGSSSFAVSCEHDTDSSRCNTESDEHTSDTCSDGGKEAKCQECRPKVTQGAGSELLQALAGVRISQPCKVVVSGLTEAHADVGRVREVASSYGEVETCYVRARENHKSWAGIVVFKEEASAADFREAVGSGSLAEPLGSVANATMGTTRYCPRFLKKQRCRDGCCPYVHSLVDTSAYAL